MLFNHTISNLHNNYKFYLQSNYSTEDKEGGEWGGDEIKKRGQEESEVGEGGGTREGVAAEWKYCKGEESRWSRIFLLESKVMDSAVYDKECSEVLWFIKGHN